MDDLIKRLDTWLQYNRPDYYRQLQLGATDDELAAVEKVLGVELPHDFRLLYKWHNGQRPYITTSVKSYSLPHKLLYRWRYGQTLEPKIETSFYYPIAFIDGYNLLPLSRIIETWEYFTELHSNEGWWRTSWIPFLVSNGVDLICVDTEGVFRGQSGQIIAFYHDDAWQSIDHLNIQSWLETVVNIFERNLYSAENNYYLTLRDSRYEQVHSEINPGYPVPFNFYV